MSFTETFTAADGTAITSLTPTTWIKHGSASSSGNSQVQSNALQTTESSVRENYYADVTPGSADYSVALGYITAQNTAEEIFGPMARCSISAATQYHFVYYRGGALFLLQSQVAGSATTIGSVDMAGSGGIAAGTYTLTIDPVGSTINCRVQRASNSEWLKSDGTWQAGQINCLAPTDTAITAAGKPGIYQLYTTGSGTRPSIDNIVFTDVGGGGSILAPVRQLLRSFATARASKY